jgi:hypothetical protein
MNDDLPIYSPTETDDYLLCPRLRVLKRILRPRGCGTWTPHIALGNAIHLGLALHYGQKMSPVGAQARAEELLQDEFVEGGEWSLEGCRKLMQKGLKVALETPLISDEGSVVGCETWAAHARLDMVTREPFGLVVTDHKVSLDLEKRKLEYKVRDLDPSWQLLHGAWACLQKYGELPRWSRAHIIALGPRPFTHIHAIEITPERIADYERSAEAHWGQMAIHSRDFNCEARLLPPMNTRSCYQYGRKCDFYELCHTYGGDLDKADALYEPKEG